MHRIDAAYCQTCLTFRGLCLSACHRQARSAKTVESSKMPFRWHTLVGVNTGATWRIRSNDPYAATMWFYIKLLWPLVVIAFFPLDLFEMNSKWPIVTTGMPDNKSWVQWPTVTVQPLHKNERKVSNFLRQLTTWHCTHLLLRARRRLLHGVPTAVYSNQSISSTRRCRYGSKGAAMVQTDGETDGRPTVI